MFDESMSVIIPLVRERAYLSLKLRNSELFLAFSEAALLNPSKGWYHAACFRQK
jgi:hypothetical protein